MRVPIVLAIVAALLPAVLVAPDESLPVAAYVEAGAPASDREWTADDYERFSKILPGIAGKNPRQLPRFDSARSGPLMKRLVSEENFAVLHDRNLPLDARIGQVVALNQSSAAILAQYVDATNKGESFDRELIELTIFITKVNIETWTAVDELLATLTPEDRETRAGGLAQMRSGSAQIVSGALTSFGETTVYRSSELRRLAVALEKLLPVVLQRLSAESAAEVIVHLRSVVNETNDEQVAASLRELLQTLESQKRVSKPAA